MAQDTHHDPPAATVSAFAETKVHSSSPALVDPGTISIDGLPGEARYKRANLLGEGGMGEVWQTRDDRIGRDVAMKVLHQKRGEDAESKRRFLREARVQGQLEHPAIVPVYDLGSQEDGSIYFTMKRLRGSSLRQIIDRLKNKEPDAQAEYTTRRLLAAFNQVCLAIEFAHERGVVHRDLKPSNIMLGDHGEVFVLDWGLARISTVKEVPSQPALEAVSSSDGQHTQDGAVMGTPGYMPPEQARGDLALLDARTDVYALGSILFELLALQPLHRGATIDSLLVSTLKGADARASARAPERAVPPELEQICVKATALEPSDRFQSARALQRAVEAFLDGDRDLELRRQLARGHAESAAKAASKALAGEDAARPEAMREVGRALALDPGQQSALRVMVELIQKPPRALPAEVQRRLDKRDSDAMRQSAKGGFMGWIGTAMFIPFYMAMGVHNWTVMLFSNVAVALSIVVSFIGWRSPAPTRRLEYLSAVLAMTSATTLAYTCGPLIMLPLAFTALLYAYALTPHPRDRVMYISVTIVVFLALSLAEWQGLIPKSYAFSNGEIHILPVMLNLPEVPTRLFLMCFAVLIFLLPHPLVGFMRDQLTAADRSAQLSLWHLQQLLPESSAAEVPAAPEPVIACPVTGTT